MCIRNESPQQVIYDMYQSVIVADKNAAIVQLFVYEWKEIFENKLLKNEKKNIIKNFLDRSKQLFNPVSKAMQDASREIFRCEPINQEEGKTYSRVEAFRAIIKHETDFKNPATYIRSCKGSCTNYLTYRLQKPLLPYFDKLPGHKECDGEISECTTLKFEDTFHVCLSKDNSDRLYEYVTSDQNDNFGKIQKSCEGKETYDLYPLNLDFYYCEQCLCTCVRVNSRRYFSLAWVTCDSYMVVTGLRITLVDQIYYLQIQQGRLLANGIVNPNTVEWKDIEPYDGQSKLYEVDWFHKNIFLDDLDLSKPNENLEVITGVKFKLSNNSLSLMTERRVFNDTTGEILDIEPYWQTNTVKPEDRTQLKLVEPDNPLAIRENHIPDSKSGQYLEFQITDLRKDVGQSTVPFLDLQPVFTNPPMPLSGVGLMHKGARGSGGYIALKLMHIHLQQYMKAAN